MSTKKFFEVVEKSGLLEDRDLADLRRQIKDSKGKITVESLAKYLVDKGLLTKFQATKLVSQVHEAPEETPKKKTPSAPKKNDDDLLELAPFDDDEPEPAPSAKPGPQSKKPAPPPNLAEEPLAEMAEGLTPIEDAKGGLTWIGQKPPNLGGLTPLPDDHSASDPFGGPMLGDAGGLDPFSAAPGGLEATTGHQPYTLKKKEQRWDTKLILGGATGLLILMLVGAGLLWNFLAVPAVALYEAAEKAYREAAYADAKEKFEGFLESYPSDENAGKARVRVLLIRLRQDAGDPQRGLDTAMEVLPLMAKEADAEMGREELPGLLPQIPEGFVVRAKQAKDPKSREELLAKAKQAMELVNNPEYIPTSKRTPILPQLNRINEDIGLIERMIVQDSELATAIGAISQAEAAGDTVKAYELHNALLKSFPALRDNAALREAVAKIAERERSLVKVVEASVAPLTQEEPRTSDFRVVLANRVGSGEAKPQNPVSAVLAAGSVYGLDSGGGQLLWRRFVGHNTRIHPVRVSDLPEADILVMDGHRQELVRVKYRTGELVWRFPIGEPSSEPCVSGAKIYLSTASGRLVEVDSATGESTRHVTIPQKLSLPPATTSDQPYIFLAGDHSNIYVLNANTLACEDVIYLGHKAGTISVPPLLLMGHIFIAENIGNNARVHAFKVRSSGEGQKIFPTQEAIRTTGRILSPLSVYNRRLLVLTDRREIRVFDVDRTKTENTVSPTGNVPAIPADPIVGYPLTDGATLWVADDKLTKYTVQVTRKEFTRDPTVTAIGDHFVAPMQLFGNTLVHVRRMAGSTGTTVACIHVDNPRQFLWQTHLGVPAGRIAVNPATNEIVAISSGASLYQINGEVLKTGYADTPLATAAGNASVAFTQPIDFENGTVAFFNPEDHRQLLVYDPAAAGSRLKIVSLQLPEGRVPCTPIAFAGGLLAPHDSGVVTLLKLADGTNQVLPFQPKLEPNEKIEWRRPAVLSPSAPEFVIADNRQNVYRIGIKDQPSPHLAEIAANRLEVELASGLAAAGDTVYGFVRANAGDLIVAISPSELKVLKEFDLKGGRVTWGPEQVGDVVMVVTDEKELRCFGPGQTEVWQKPAVMHGQPAGKPLVDGDHFVFASIPGTVWRVARATGEEQGKAELGEPLGAGPVGFRGRLLLCGNDGALHVISMPAPAATTGG